MNCTLSQHLQGRHPPRIHLRVNNRCRFKCNHCQGKSNEGVCADDALDPILDALALLGPLQIMWCGGEPLLSPRLAEYVTSMADRGCCNVVCTNMVVGDPLGALAGRFVYHVEIHGCDRMDFKQRTGWDLFNEFRYHFQKLFDCGHVAEAGIAIKADWREYLEPRIRWLSDYPIRYVRLFDDRTFGSMGFGHYAIQEPAMAEMKQRLADINPKFQVIFPMAETSESERIPYITMSSDDSAFCEISGIKVNDRDSFTTMLEQWTHRQGAGRV